MKAELDKFGELKIIPESGVESYALGKWFKDFKEDQSALTICVDEK